VIYVDKLTAHVVDVLKISEDACAVILKKYVDILILMILRLNPVLLILLINLLNVLKLAGIGLGLLLLLNLLTIIKATKLVVKENAALLMLCGKLLVVMLDVKDNATKYYLG